MKRDKLLGLMILIVFCLAACGAGVEQSAEPERTHNLWTRACVVVEVNGDSVVAEDSVGHRWGFTDTEEYWEVGDGCSLLLDDNGTQEIYDDIIMGADFYRVDILNDVSAAGGVSRG